MYKNENVLFGQVGIRSGILQERYLQEYISECPEHSMMFSQWLLYKKYVDQNQVNMIVSHIDQSKQNSSAVQTTATRNARGTVAGTSQQPRQLSQEPQTIGRYKVICVLGQGGMGKVYKVFDPQLQKELALKVNFCGDASSKAAVRFRREAKTMTALNHPGIVKAYDIGCQDNQMFFTMDLVKGVSLKEWQLSTPMTVKQSVKFIIQVCEIMDYAHRNGVVHRDLKPGNIMVDNGKPIIMDFGLVKVEEASQKLSKTGVMMGTLRYMAPEQVEGRHSATTAQSDLYSIAAILYELLTRRPIFTVKGHAALLNSIFNKDPIPLREVNPKIPKELEDVCLKALAKHKKHRHQSCKTFANDLRKFGGGNVNNNTRRTSARTLATRNTTQSNGKVWMVVGGTVALLLLLVIAMNSGNSNTSQNISGGNSVDQPIETAKKSQNKNTTSQNTDEIKGTPQNNEKKSNEKQNNKKQNSKSQSNKKQNRKKQKPKDFDWKDAIVGFKFNKGAIVDRIGKFGILKTSILGRYPGRDHLIVIPGRQGKLEVAFQLNRIPEKLWVGLSHLSTRANNDWYSPINVVVNGEVVEANFNPGGRVEHLNKFEITKSVKVGTNVVSIQSARTATSNHWLFSFGIFPK
ncbi:serine/threonine protein kinase [Candidatus Uabimicrobium amorphum]|uniref:Protein kinase n=1 Tax=Uabimicrobium amorphum TaxID=2596890 RepID=A0A5S9IUD3_UABAM|nr:serine/threonine-protein kinase [Candidatus Uabimicrobium amorphum]BBM87551.1 protein kinase [Candidatus Uabimicrobium amorphum]